jgi:hypothetical protein
VTPLREDVRTRNKILAFGRGSAMIGVSFRFRSDWKEQAWH